MTHQPEHKLLIPTFNKYLSPCASIFVSTCLEGNSHICCKFQFCKEVKSVKDISKYSAQRQLLLALLFVLT